MVLEPTGIRSLLIRAWRERWTDIQWGIHIKTVLPRYISGDIYQLSDCLLQQALMGSLPNNLILSYLHHSLASRIVSFGGVIESISKYDGLNKPYCVQALLNILQSMMRSVNCRGKPEDCLMLASSLVAGVKWLIMVMNVATEKLVELQTAPEHLTNLTLARSVVQEILSNPFLMCLLHIGCKDDTVVWKECVLKICQLETDISGCASTVISDKDVIVATLSKIKQMKPLSSINEKEIYDPNKSAFCHSISSLVYLEVMEHTTRDAKIITKQLLLLQKFKGISLSELYFEVIRTCFMGISAEKLKEFQEFMWIGFTYIKLPTIIHSIHTLHYGENAGFSTELQVAFQKIALMTALLDFADYSMKCNCLEFLFKELIPKAPQPNQASQSSPSLDLLSERDAQTILATRIQESNVLKLIKDTEASQASPLSTPDLILRAQPTVIGIMKTIINKNMDSVMPVLSLLISGKSRELLLISATSSGSLHIYAQKFVKLNESSMEPTPGETSKMAATRGIVFDISFLILCHIAQMYGIQVVVSESCNTFIEKWILKNIPELGKIKMVINPSEVVDANAIEEYLRQINCIDSDSKYVKNNFPELCRLSAFTMRELIFAAHQGQVQKQMVYDLLDKFCRYLCALPVCITAWLCSYLQQVDGEEAALALDLIQYMQNAHNREEPNPQETFGDRAFLMSGIIGHMVEIIKKPPPTQNKNGNLLNSPVFLSEVVAEVWSTMKASDGILIHKALNLSRDLVRLGGVKWFVANFVRSAMENVFESELFRCMDVVYGLFHLDIYSCTIDHLVHTMPSYICGPLSADLICEPRPFALGRLTAMLLVECWTTIQPDSIPQSTSETSSTLSQTNLSSCKTRQERGQKRTYSQIEMEDMISNMLSSDLHINIASLPVDLEVKFFLYAVINLFTIMNRVIRTAVVSPVTHLIVFTLKELISFPHSSTILSLLPPSLLMNLLPLLSDTLTFDYPQLLALSAPECLQENTTPLPLDSLINSLKKEKDIRQSSAKILCAKRNIELFNMQKIM